MKQKLKHEDGAPETRIRQLAELTVVGAWYTHDSDGYPFVRIHFKPGAITLTVKEVAQTGYIEVEVEDPSLKDNATAAENNPRPSP